MPQGMVLFWRRHGLSVAAWTSNLREILLYGTELLERAFEERMVSEKDSAPTTPWMQQTVGEKERFVPNLVVGKILVVVRGIETTEDKQSPRIVAVLVDALHEGFC